MTSHERRKEVDIVAMTNICGHLWHRQFVTVTKVIMATVKRLKW